MKASEFDRKFDEGDDVTAAIDISKMRRGWSSSVSTSTSHHRWWSCLDREAKRLGVTRQSVIKVWIADRLKRKAS